MWKGVRCAILTHLSPADSITRMGSEIAAAFEALGVAATFVCMRPDNLDFEYVVQLFQSLGRHDGPKFLYDFNGKVNPHVHLDGVGTSLLRRLRIPRFSQMIDHPALHENYLALDHHQTAWGVVAAHHVEAARDLVVGGPVMFLPHGGPRSPLTPTPEPAARAIDILFCANVRGASPLGETLAQALGGDPALQRAGADAVEAHVSGGAALSEALSRNLWRIGARLDRAAWSSAYAAIEAWVVGETRRATLAALPADCELVLCGEAPRDLTVPPRTKRRGMVEFADFLDMAGNARIVLNARSPFRDGAHERVFYGLSRGAAVLTDGAEYLAGDAAALPLSFYAPSGEGLATAVEALRARNAGRTRAAMAEEAAYYRERHSWETRMTAALEFMAETGVLEL